MVEEQAESIKVLDIVHKNHLISEESYQSSLAAIYQEWGPKIEKEYSDSIDRVAKLTDSASGDQRTQYQKKLTDLQTAQS